MANSSWKKFEKSRAYARIKLAIKRLCGQELRLRPAIQLTTVECSDWIIHPDTLDDAVVYSLGVGEETAFDEDLIRIFGAEVHAFDPTPNTRAWLAPRQLPDAFHFHPWAVTATDGTLTLYPRRRKDGSMSKDMLTMLPEAGVEEGAVQVAAYCLGSIKDKLQHEQIDLLKMDIEGAEYEVLADLIDTDIRPTQLLVEFHHRFSSIDKSRTANIIERLQAVGYRIFAVSVTGREVSFFHQAS